MINGVRHIAILGAGESGIGAAILAIKKGYSAFVSDAGPINPTNRDTLDKHGVLFEADGHSITALLSADLIVKSPGIPDKAEIVTQLKSTGKPVISEIEFAALHTNATLIAITGSNGKTTTTLLTYHMLKKAGLDVAVAGNVGFSFARQLAASDRDYFVLEVSSFQLDGCVNFRPHIAILTNITPDHLDRYEYNMDLYIKSKFSIAKNQGATNHFIYCADDPVTGENINKFNINAQMHAISAEDSNASAFADNDNKITLNIKGDTMNIEELALQGKHNMYNSMAAGLAGRLLNIRQETVRESLQDFEGLPHRLEPVLDVHGISFINDSKATNVNSTYYALESMTQPTIWIVGGVDKGNDYSQLKDLVKKNVKAIVCLGLDNSKIIEEFASDVDMITETQSMQDAVRTAYMLGKKGDTVLLSPACASFDLFTNYEDRGNQFKAQIRQL